MTKEEQKRKKEGDLKFRVLRFSTNQLQPSAFSLQHPHSNYYHRRSHRGALLFLLLTLLLFYIFLLFPLFPPLPVNIIALYSLPPHLVTPPERRVQKEEEPQLGLTRVLGSPRFVIFLFFFSIIQHPFQFSCLIPLIFSNFADFGVTGFF